MIATPFFVKLSPLEEERFGMRSARATIPALEYLPEVMDFCRQNAVAFLIVRCPVMEMRLVQTMEREGFHMMDVLIYYSRNLKKTPLPAYPSHMIARPMRSGEEDEVRFIAIEAFRGYHGHYHADERLDREKCDEVYISWAMRSSASREVADEVLVVELDGRIAGYITLKLNTPQQGEGGLIGVDPAIQGHGIGGALMTGALHWFAEHGADEMIIATQLTNIPSQKVWVRLGFGPSEAYCTLHKWFDE